MREFDFLPVKSPVYERGKYAHYSTRRAPKVAKVDTVAYEQERVTEPPVNEDMKRKKLSLPVKFRFRMGIALVVAVLISSVIYPALGNWFGKVEAAGLQSIQTGSVTMNNATETATLGTAVDMSKAFVLCDHRSNTSDASRNLVRCQLTASDTVTFNIGGANSSTVVHWRVIEFINGVSVQRNTEVFGSGDTTRNVTISSIDTSQTFSAISVSTALTASNSDEQRTIRSRFTTATNLELARNESGVTTTVDWQVVSITDGSASVQHGTVDLTSGLSATATISSIDPEKTFLLFSGAALSTAAGVEGRFYVTGDVTDATTLTFERGVNSSGVNLAYQAITFAGGIKVQRGSLATGSGGTTELIDITLPSAVNTGRSFAMISVSSDGTGNQAIDELAWSSEITSSTNLRIERVNDTVASTVAWQVVEFLPDPTLSQANYRWFNNADTIGAPDTDWWNASWSSRRKITLDTSSLAATTTVESRINSASDDAEEFPNTSLDRFSTDLELINEPVQGDQIVGMRFTNITVPKGATITNAYIQFTVDETSSGTTNLTFHAEASDNATTYVSNGDISGRTRTSASVAWNNVPAWNVVGAAGADQRTPNLSNIIQEVVDRSGWSSGNALAINVTGSGRRTALSYDGSSADAPLLHVEYKEDKALTDFPIRVSLTSSEIDYAKTQSAGEDIRFVDEDDETVLSHEIEVWDEGGTSEVWVKVPELRLGTNEEYIWMYYDNADAEDGQDASGVWSNGYEGVYHMSQDPSGSAPQMLDSSGNNRHGTVGGGLSSVDSISAKIGKGLLFDGTDDYVQISGLMDTPSQLTMEAWSRLESSDPASDESSVVSIGDYAWIRMGNDWIIGDYYYGSDWHETLEDIDFLGQGLRHVAYTVNPGDSNQQIFVDGTAIVTTTHSDALVWTGLGANTHIGRHGNGSASFDFGGLIDEVRFSSIARTSEWMAAQYVSMENGLNSFGSEESYMVSWWDMSWTSRRKITFDNSASSEDLINFPVRVSLSAGNIDYTKTQNSGQDLRFIDGDGTVLSHEIETWDESGTSEVWVKIPKLNASSSTDFIYMYYNNAAVGDGQDPTGVWDSSHSGVWHLDEDPTISAPQMSDSTGNGNHGTTQGSISNASYPIAGQINGAVDFDGTNDYVQVSDSESLSPTSAITVEAWFKGSVENTGGLIGIVNKSHGGGVNNQPYGLHIEDGVVGFVTTLTFSNTYSALYDGITDDTWYYVVGTYDGENMQLYVNGTLQDTTASPGIVDNDANLNIGQQKDGFNRFFDGIIDEVRVHSTNRSSEWIEAQYISMSNNMNSFGPEETAGVEIEDIKPLKPENTPIVLGLPQLLRLRINLSIADDALAAGIASFKLQYATSISGSWTDVGAAGSGEAWRFADNPTPGDGSTLIGAKLSGTTSLQSYTESNPTVVNPAADDIGGYAEWDFVLDPANAASATTYYFRMVKADGTELSSYENYPQIAVVYPEHKMRHGRWFDVGSGAEQEFVL